MKNKPSSSGGVSARSISVPHAGQVGEGRQNLQSSSATNAPAPFKAIQLDPEMFPNPGGRKGALRTTTSNVEHLMIEHGIRYRYNLIKKKLELGIPGIETTAENADNVLMTHICSLAAQNYMNPNSVPEYVYALADRNAYNPVADWINSRKWDGIDRLPSYYATLTTREGYPEHLKHVIMRKWLLSGVAAALKKSAFRSRGVLTLQGPQSIGKTTWGKNLISDPILRDSVVKTDHHLDGSNKDSLLSAITHFLVEIGELESSLKRDIARLKGFLTADHDKIRRPYARFDSEYPRRTIFYATVNQADFLVDNTGNSRWWTIAVVQVDFEHNIDMQQLFAQLAEEYHQGAEWWLTPEEEALLETQNRNHQSISIVREAMATVVDMDGAGSTDIRPFTPTELLKFAGIERPTNPQAKECAAILRELFGECKRRNGRDKWRVPVFFPDEADDEPKPAADQPRPQKNFD